MIKYYAASKKSKDHRTNGDYISIDGRVICSGEVCGVSDGHVVAVICDGGDSPIIAKAIINGFTRNTDIEQGGTTAASMYLRSLNQQLYADAKIDPHIAHASINVAGQVAFSDARADFNVGNVRSYGHRKDSLWCISNTFIYTKHGDGHWGFADEPALGSYSDCLPHVDIKGGYKYSIICSDGLYQFTDGCDVERIMDGSGTLPERGRAIMELALKNGSTDDLSLVILENNIK